MQTHGWLAHMWQSITVTSRRDTPQSTPMKLLADGARFYPQTCQFYPHLVKLFRQHNQTQSQRSYSNKHNFGRWVNFICNPPTNYNAVVYSNLQRDITCQRSQEQHCFISWLNIFLKYFSGGRDSFIPLPHVPNTVEQKTYFQYIAVCCRNIAKFFWHIYNWKLFQHDLTQYSWELGQASVNPAKIKD